MLTRQLTVAVVTLVATLMLLRKHRPIHVRLFPITTARFASSLISIRRLRKLPIIAAHRLFLSCLTSENLTTPMWRHWFQQLAAPPPHSENRGQIRTGSRSLLCTPIDLTRSISIFPWILMREFDPGCHLFNPAVSTGSNRGQLPDGERSCPLKIRIELPSWAPAMFWRPDYPFLLRGSSATAFRFRCVLLTLFFA